MALFARSVVDEKDALLTFLAQQRDALRASVLIKEVARHAGHADLIREALDGQRAGALDRAYDAQSG